jgi:hypothetical protein
MNFLTVALNISIALTILSLLLILIIVGLHLIKNRDARREEEFRRTAVPTVRRFLAGSGHLETVITILAKAPTRALNLLIEFSEATTGNRNDERLKAVFEAFPFVERELAALKSRRANTRVRNAQLLGYLRDESAVPALLEALEDEILAVRLAAAQSLARLGAAEAVGPIMKALDIPGEMPQRRVAEAVAELGPRAIAPTLAILNEPTTSESQLAVAARVCGLLHADKAVPRLVDLLKNNSLEVRLNSVRALAAIGDSSAIPAIARLAKDPAWEVRTCVMRALGYLQAEDQVPTLADGLADLTWWVRFSAAQALYQAGGAGREVLKNAATHHLDSFSRDISRQVLQEQGLHPTPAPLP